MVYAFLTVDAV